MKTEYLDLKVDFMFKQLFGQPSRKHITIAFLNDLLGRKGNNRIQDLQFINTEISKETKDGKTVRLDLAVNTANDENINVEIQIINKHDLPERILYYWAKTYSSSIHSGELYQKLRPTISISILNFSLFPSETDDFHTTFHIRENSKHFLWSDHLEFHVFDLTSFVVQWRKYHREMMQNNQLPWLLMLSAVDYPQNKLDDELMSELEEWAMNIEQVREALIEWETISANKENRVIYEARAKELRDLLSNLEGERRLGKEIGRKEANHQNALMMIKKGLDLSLIEEITGLTREEILKLKQNEQDL
ncbi:Rpn family recombination-promoting nuclease/putative transposase [Bacillus sp. REN16]|uniref:Rpn family recombination-promoting nuclease/putative transposase n=1 Tax=Bacillus sp. REN16 TaxID=2887296 RepID=UPI001E5067D9|nr:Rpn family recombination-promoting nuclease/putative transposase [Bacillus sp. REN16]MCC3358205.1 Rpn family recombination-promoting nuclease/putative transposase [Bacillus sp. REN16]